MNVDNSNVAELVQMSADQLQSALAEASRSIESLTELVGTGLLAREPEQLTRCINQMVVQLQFADRLQQRLGSSCQNLAGLAAFLRDGDGMPQGWKQLLDQTRATYTTESERNLFDRVYGEKPKEHADEEDAILFFEGRS